MPSLIACLRFSSPFILGALHPKLAKKKKQKRTKKILHVRCELIAFLRCAVRRLLIFVCAAAMMRYTHMTIARYSCFVDLLLVRCELARSLLSFFFSSIVGFFFSFWFLLLLHFSVSALSCGFRQ